MTLLEHALEHASRGARVLTVFNIGPDGNCTCQAGASCKSAGKHPSLTDWPNRATTDEATIREWWGKRPYRNIGLATGMESGFFVLDIDPAKGGDDTLWDLEGEHGVLPHTWEALTPTGGSHRFFKAVPGLPNSVDLLGPGLDIRGEGGQVVAAGSVRACGTYEWELSSRPDEVELAEAPEWLLEMIFKGGAAAKKNVGPATRDIMADWTKVKAGCPALAYAAGEGQPKQGRPAWRHVVLNVISFCDNAQEHAHEASRNHPQYNAEETDREIQDALTKTHSPVKCKRIETAYGLGEFCKGCQHRNTRIGTPVTLGRPKLEVWQAGSHGRVLPEGVEKHPERPCYSEIAGTDREFTINGADRIKVFYALASQSRKQELFPIDAYKMLEKVNKRRCLPKFQPREIERVVGDVYQSGTVPTSGCDSLQVAGFCPAKDGRFYCPLYEARQESEVQKAASTSSDEYRLCIMPMAVLWTKPPIFYPTVEGKQIEVPAEFITKWIAFQDYVAKHPEVGRMIPIHDQFVPGADGKRHKVPEQKVWAEVYNEAMESRIDLPPPPEDATPEGIAWEGVRRFIRETTISEVREDLRRGRVYTEEGRLYFRGPDLLAFLKLQSIEALTTNHLWAMLRRRGAEHGVVRAGDRTHKVWSIPSSSVDDTAEPTVPERLSGALLL